jgi:hypothetical protein
MAQFNLIRNGLINSLTSSGTGNVVLTVDQKYSLYDNNTTSSGISLSATDKLYLDIDLYNRVEVNDINLFMSTVLDKSVVSSNIDFYYKNYEIESFSSCNKSYDDEKFYVVDFPELFAPRYLRIIVDSVEGEVFELEILNDDTVVSFGPNGNKTLDTIDNGYLGYDMVEIFNNSPEGTDPVNAYVIVDYQGNPEDNYIKLSNNSNGPYKGINDYPYFNSDDHSKLNFWSQGRFDGTQVYEGRVTASLSRAQNVGYYTTPVISFGDVYTYTYLISEQDKLEGVYKITWSEMDDNLSTVMARSNNTAPEDYNRFIAVSLDGAGYPYLRECNMDSLGTIYSRKLEDATFSSIQDVFFDRRNSHIIVLINNDRVSKYEYEASTHTFGAWLSSSSNFNISGKWGVDYDGRIWCQNSNGGNYKLQLLTHDFSSTTTLIDNGTIELATDLSVHPSQITCWLSDTERKEIKHVDETGTFLATVSLNNPTNICAIADGGCWVVDADETYINRYSYSGELIKKIKYSSEYTVLDIDYGIDVIDIKPEHEVFWLLTTDGTIFKYNFDGTLEGTNRITGSSRIIGSVGGCLVLQSSNNKIFQLNNNAEFVYEWGSVSNGGEITNSVASVFIDYNEALKLPTSSVLIPSHDDPVWGTDHDEGWQEVPMDGYLLPMAQFHQFKYKFNNYALELPIINPGAETGDTTGWILGSTWPDDFNFSAATDPNYIREGTYGFRARSWSYSGLFFYQDIDITTTSGIDLNVIDNVNNIYDYGYIFTLDVWIRAVEFGGGSFHFKFKFYDENHNPILPDEWTYSTIYNVDNTPNTWFPLHFDKKLPSGTRIITIKHEQEVRAYRTISLAIDSWHATLVRPAGLKSISIPAPVRIDNITPQTSKPLYVKTDFPVGVDKKQYETRLKCWWGNVED